MRGLSGWAPAAAYGRTQFAGDLLLRPRQTVTVSLRYRLPLSIAAPTYGLTVQRQPGSRIESYTLQIRMRGRLVRAARVQAPGSDIHVQGPAITPGISLQFPVSHDTVHLSGQVAPAVSRLTRDPYIPYQSFADPRHPL
jgi:hypothetical protein